MTIRVFGIGSPSGDDQAGWLTIDALLDRGVQHVPGATLGKLDRPGASLIAHLQDADRVILIDAMLSGCQPGLIRRFDQEDWPDYSRGLSSHGLGVLDALLLARALGSLPPRLDLYGIEIGVAAADVAPGSEVRASARQLAARIATELASASPS